MSIEILALLYYEGPRQQHRMNYISKLMMPKRSQFFAHHILLSHCFPTRKQRGAMSGETFFQEHFFLLGLSL